MLVKAPKGARLMLIKIKHDPTLRVEGNALQRAAKAAQSMARQRRYLRLARYAPDQMRFMLDLWYRERTYWAHLLGLTSDQRQPKPSASRL